MAQCLARSQTFAQFIRPSSLLSYTQANQTLTVFLNIIWKAMNSNGLNAMPALSKFLVLLALILSASHVNVSISLSSVAGNQVRINHLTRLQQPISDPTNESSRKPICKPTTRIDLDAVLPNNLSQINNAVLYNHRTEQLRKLGKS